MLVSRSDSLRGTGPASCRLGVSTYSLYKWLKGVGKTPRLAVQEDLRAENARLKAELKRVEEERDIQKKAAAYFAKASG